MGRGLSELQKSILKMAYERFLEVEEKENKESRERHPGNPNYMDTFQGLHYAVYVGPALPSIDSLTDWRRKGWLVEGRLAADPFEDPGGPRRDALEAEVQAELDAEVERVRAAKRELEEKVRPAVPEWWEKPEDNDYYWSPPSWSRWSGPPFYGRPEKIAYERFELASFRNNEEEARRYRRILEEKGLDGTYYWGGGGLLYTADILQRVYGFEAKYSFDYVPAEFGGQRNAIKFDPEQIGKERYNAARASVSRALARLHNRMLIEHGGGAGTATITLRGIAELTGQTVKEVCIAHKINRTDGSGRRLIKGEPERSPTPEGDAAAKGLQDLLNPPPQPLGDAFLNAILDEVVYRGTMAEEDVREAFEDALGRAKDRLGEEAETANESVEPQKP
jgi:hypothetical protein